MSTDNDGTIEAVANSLLANIPEQESNLESDTPEVESEDVQEEILDEGDMEESDETDADEAEVDEDDSEDVAEELDDDGQDALEVFSVKVDGEEVQVSIDDLKRSYSGQAYIQKGMQEAANQKKEAEAVYQALLQERQQTSQLLSQMQSGEMLQEPQAPTKELFNKDPIGYMEAKMQYDEAKSEFDKQQATIQQAQAQQNQQMEYARQVYLKEEMQKLTQVIPDFADPEKAGKMRDDLVQGGMKLGFSEAELAEVSDHRALVALYKAMKYDEIVNGKEKAVNKTKNSRKMVKPGAKKSASLSKVKAREKAVSRMKQTGDVNDVANFIIS